MAKKQKYIGYVVPETHWDRDWYATFEEFRMRLVGVTDKLLKVLDTNRRFTCFVFDGQTVVLEDYLAIRPEREADVRRHVKSGRLAVGPWYILPDEFLVSGEATVRNLMVGHAIARDFGRVMRAGYIPDPFGHISQMPQLLQGFGIDSIIFTRGMGEEGNRLGVEFEWVSSDGQTSVMAVNQVIGYGNLCNWGVPPGYPTDTDNVDMAAAAERIAHLVKAMEDHGYGPTTRYLLFNNGVDHFPAQGRVPDMIDYTNKELPNIELRQGSFEDFVDAVRAARPKLRKFKGELHKGKYAPLLSGVFSARMYIKQANQRAQTSLERYGEPVSALASVEGAEYPAPYLLHAWKELLKNHPHDDICGCSIDQVHRDMMPRFAAAEQVGALTSEHGLAHIGSKIDTRSDAGGAPFGVWNPLLDGRCERVQVQFDVRGDLIGKGVLAVIDSQGRLTPAKVERVSSRPANQWEDHYFHGTDIVSVRVTLLAADLPACGYSVFRIVPAAGKWKKSAAKAVTADGKKIENEFFSVTANANGTVDIRDRKTGKTWRGCAYIEDTEDTGDEYDYSPARRTKTVTSKKAKARVKIDRDGDARASLVVSFTMRIPRALTLDRNARAKGTVAVPVTTRVSLTAGLPRIDFSTTIDNKALDHRMRVVFQTGLRSDLSWAAEKFDVISRPVDVPAVEGWSQMPLPTHHMDAFVEVTDGKYGFAVLNRGLPEYEARRTGKGLEICQTLFRSVGWLSRGDFITRPYGAGPHVPAPEAQCLGEATYEYAVLPHRGNWDDAGVPAAAEAYLAPPVGFPLRVHRGRLPQRLSFVTLEPGNLVMTALKKREKGGRSLIVRFFNPGKRTASAKLRLYRPVKRAWLSRLDETRLEELDVVSGNGVRISAKPKNIITVELQY